jgi:hypothetical protein
LAADFSAAAFSVLASFLGAAFFLVSSDIKIQLVDAGLGVRIALHADGLTRTFACAGVGLCALAAHGQAAQMADATIAFDALQTLEVHAEFAPQITFDNVFAVLNGMNNLRELLLVQVFGANARINFRLGQNDLRVFGGTSTPIMRAINR